MQQDMWSPTRLVDIGTHDEPEWNLDLPSTNSRPKPVYITLSYRWGSDDDFSLTEEKLKSGFRGRIEDLPQTFRDAVVVARLLSVRYIWVDRLCIVQDSKADWERESVEMRRVYANSFCNIAASASTSPKGGLFRTRNPEDIRPGRVIGTFGTLKRITYDVFDEKYLERQVFSGPLHRRGWVFQERVLAPRTIHFAEDQVFWECFTEVKCEAFPGGMSLMGSLKSGSDFLSGTSGSGTFDRNTFMLWDQLVEQYTQCKFTRESDKLVAFSGIAHLFQEITGDEYVAGLWRSRLVEFLEWWATTPTLRSSDEYRAPSWSWASISGPVVRHYMAGEPTEHVTILDIQVQSSRPKSMGVVLSGSILMNGSIFQALCNSIKGNSSYMVEFGPRKVKGWMCPDALEAGYTEGRLVSCLPIRTMLDRGTFGVHTSMTHFLVLEPLSSGLDVYRRVGYLRMKQSDWLEGSGITINTEGKAVYITDGKQSEITLI